MMSSLLWTLIAIQIAMEAFDTFYHHEMTELLAWRPSQRHELQLHSIRNALTPAVPDAWLVEVPALGDSRTRGPCCGSLRHAAGFVERRYQPETSGERTDQPHFAGAELRRHLVLLLPT